MTPLTAICVAGACALVGARVEIGDGRVLERANVLVRDGRIVDVTTAAPPAGLPVLDVAGKTVTPGLFEASSNLGLVEVGAEKSSNDSVPGGALFTPAFRAADGFNASSLHVETAREEGVTAAIVRPDGGLLSGQGGLARLTGRAVDGPDPARPVALFGQVGAGAAEAAGGARGSVWLALRQLFDDARWYAANRAAVDRNAGRPLASSPLQLQALLPVLEGRLPLVLAADRASDLRAALAFAKEQKIRLAIEGGAEAWLLADELAAAKVAVIVAPSAQDPSSLDRMHARDDLAAVLHARGVLVVLTSSANELNLRRLRQEAGLAVAWGLPRDVALAAITGAPAKLYGLDGELGLVAKGRRADLVIWSGDPLEHATVAERVLIGGIERDTHTRQRELAEKYLRR